MVLSSTKLSRSEFFSHKIDQIGPNIEPCDRPDRIILKRLKMLLTDTFCFHSFKCAKRKVAVLNPKLSACSFTIRRSSGMQSNVFGRFDRPIRTVLVKILVSKAFLQCLMS